MADLTPHVRAGLNAIALQLASMPLAAEERRKVFDHVLVEMANASGVPMHGHTAYSSAAASPPETGVIAAVLGATPTPHRNRYAISPFDHPALGASGTVIYTDEQTGEAMTLLVRARKSPDRWGLPGGYMDILPEAKAIYPDRVDMKTRDTLEEHLPDAAPLPVKAGELPGEAFASFAQAQPVLNAHYNTLLQTRGWEEADRLMHDEHHVMGVLVANGIKLPQKHGFDFDAEGCYKRELKEEGGLDLSHYPDAKTIQVKSDISYGYSSGNSHSYTVNPHFLTDLGVQASSPTLGPHESDIVEAKWIPLSRIRSEHGTYVVDDGEQQRTLGAYAVPSLERSLHAYLCERIKAVSDGQLESPQAVQAALATHAGWLKAYRYAPEAAARALAENLSDEGRLSTLAGPEGKQRMASFLSAAEGLKENLVSRRQSVQYAPSQTLGL